MKIKSTTLLFFVFYVGLNAAPKYNPDGHFAKKSDLNEMFIIDFFLNFELTNVNDNFSLIMDYVQSSSKSSGRTIKLEVFDEYEKIEESLQVKYDDQAKIKELLYSNEALQNPRIYSFEYDGDQLRKIWLRNKVKFQFKYDKKARLKAIQSSGASGDGFVLNFIYGKEKFQVDLRFDVLQEGKMKAHDAKGFIKWNAKNQMISYAIFRYTGEKISYTKNGEIEQVDFLWNLTEKKKINWNYVYDSNKFWVERKLEDRVFMSRKWILDK